MRIDFHSFVILAPAVTMTLGATYQRSSQLAGQSFLDAFSFQAIPDPTNGRVTYVNETDYTTTLSSSDPGRNSFRIESNIQYETHVAIFDIAHMPQGCGTWPAILGANWPNEGEVDIVEGVNDQTPNTCSLHTGSNCTMPSSRPMTGSDRSSSLQVFAPLMVPTATHTDNGNSGCGVSINDDKSYGPQFNSNGGGWYAIERSSRLSDSVPSDINSPGSSINTSNWGTPAAYFPDTDCDFSTHFGEHNIIINLTFCGDWAGSSSVYAASGCPSTCVDYVDDNPSAFENAYFEFNSLNIYQ
ncbi:glycoside hydrolase family 16 protein [Suillus subalutaceus]|uniref:glycoside hydrolase family 16 protein n=1 Tax=Suillus subalutaceus TaxID=48586 RepID=UPI001B8603BC|nr:glycoside hydrolase family 16 protein [Suillus subalutaceus]KAG1835360.1 glycoside hydrolase family 16 protein [Suillus subalutaceus]